MDGRRTALIVASDEFEHAGLSGLKAPLADAEALAGVLGDAEIGGFDVEVVHNAPSHAVQAHVEDLFAEGRPEDLLLLHFSGHGLKSDSGELFFAATNTRPDRLASTAISADFVQRCMRGSRARSIVLLLDCCYGGAFGEGVAVRSAGPANVLDSFPAGKLGGGRGRAVITASSAMEYAFEGSSLATDDQQQPSVFTSAVVEGLRSGAADRDEDGLVSLNELYDYVFDQVRARNPNQTPSRDIELQGELYVAKSRRLRVRAVALPPDLRAAVQDGNMYTRLGAVGELRARLASADPGVALGAREALQLVAREDTSYVADAAREALAAHPPATATPPPQEAAAPPQDATAPPVERAAPPGETDPAPREKDALPLVAATASPPVGTTTPPAAVRTPAGRSTPMPLASTVEPPPAAPPTRRLPRHRVGAGRTLLTGGGLLLLSVISPDYVRSDTVFAFDRGLAVVLLCVGATCAAVAAAALFLPWLRPRWPWPVAGMAVAAGVTLWLVLDTSADLGASEVDVGIWLALGGCLTATAAGVVALLGLRSRPDTPVQGDAVTVSPLARAVGTGAIVTSGMVVVSTFAVRFAGGTQALVAGDIPWAAWLFPGLLGVVAGLLTLRPRGWRPIVGPALVAGAGAAALWGVWDLPRTLITTGTSDLNTGFFLEFAGLIGLIAVAAAALVLLSREHRLALARPTVTYAALVAVVALLAVIPFVRVARANLTASLSGNAAHDIEMIVLVVLVPLLTTAVRPSLLGRVMLAGWAVATAGTVVAYWRLLRYAGAPLFGVPYALLALAALFVIALAFGRGGLGSADDSDNPSGGDGDGRDPSGETAPDR